MQTLKGKYTDATIYAETIEEEVYSQVYDIINNPAFKDQKVLLMPDTHCGKAGPIGLVATIGDYICPEHVGVDIGCTCSGMVLSKKMPVEKYADFEHKVKTKIPFGFVIHEHSINRDKEFYKFLTTKFHTYKMSWPEMLSDLPEHVTEKWVSDQLKRLNMDEGTFYKSIGTVGGGNHFIEYNESDDEKYPAMVTMHFGSRNFGVKVCKYWMSRATTGLSRKEIKEYTNYFKEIYQHFNGNDMSKFKDALNIYLEDIKSKRINGYLTGDDMKGYLQDMCFAQSYASWNHLMTQSIIADILKKYNIKVTNIIETTHNYVNLGDHTLRKSAITAYKNQLVLVPFNMRDGVAVCIGKGNEEWLNSCSHGAGRKMSRSAAKKNVDMEEFRNSMKDVYSTSVCESTLDESPMAYKDTDEIARIITDTVDIICFMKPKINIKAI